MFEFSKAAELIYEITLAVTEYFTDSSRFDLELKTNTEFSVS